MKFTRKNGATFLWVCNTTEPPPTTATSPRFAYAGSIPSSITVPEIDQADPFDLTYGMPMLSVINGANGVPNLYTKITASSVSSDHASATFPMPSSLPAGAYTLIAGNLQQNGGYSTNAYNAYIVASSTSVAGNPYSVSVSAQTVMLNEGNSCVRPPVHVSSSNYVTFPVVSLYSSNQVLVNGSAINVGTNPTAIAAYKSSSVIINSGSNCDRVQKTYSGTTRAIVANSGGNTVTILDIINRDALATITVGNQPIALATAADGSAAYVANYTDKTVSRIDLSTNAVTSTVAVGGNPTSVSLTAGGTLWVGGAGFLTQVNASTMSIVGTEAVPNKNIVALAYSDPYGQLIVQSTDSSGTVYQDEMNPSSFTAGGAYTVLASHNISTLGSYLVGAQSIRAFSSTASRSNNMPATLPGAPPIVVQDGWVVIAATPTGFTITDVSGHVVLVSQTTASPITAIAVDSKLNVAYLTEPDSNILLTVPLPGTASE